MDVTFAKLSPTDRNRLFWDLRWLLFLAHGKRMSGLKLLHVLSGIKRSRKKRRNPVQRDSSPKAESAQLLQSPGEDAINEGRLKKPLRKTVSLTTIKNLEPELEYGKDSISDSMDLYKSSFVCESIEMQLPPMSFRCSWCASFLNDIHMYMDRPFCSKCRPKKIRQDSRDCIR
mmetsp:Transcript_914/g.1258  ORF Transcript_914/g.1258 Transcript_914/m.1258 type:complete len:173 (-) Transcript_914:268-786(-)